MARQCRDGRVIPVRVSRWRRVLVGVLCAAYAAAVLCYWEWSWVQAALLLAGAAAGVWAMLLPHDVSELVLEDKGVAYLCYRGQKQPARLGAGSLIVPRWACLSWQLEGGGSVAQVLLPDSLSAEDWRFFYVWAQLWQKD